MTALLSPARESEALSGDHPDHELVQLFEQDEGQPLDQHSSRIQANGNGDPLNPLLRYFLTFFKLI